MRRSLFITLLGLGFLALFTDTALAFINFCFPISMVILIHLLQGIFYPLNFIGHSGASDLGIYIGPVIVISLLYLIGSLIDIRIGAEKRKYAWRLPLTYVLICLLLFGFMFIDPTCL